MSQDKSYVDQAKESSGAAQAKAGEMYEQVKDTVVGKASEAQDAASKAASDAQKKASDAASAAQDKASDLTGVAKVKGSQLGDQANQALAGQKASELGDKTDQAKDHTAGKAKDVTSTMTAWTILPDNVAERILRNLSLVNLARLSTTCRSFHALFCRWMAEEQQARCDLAVKWFGRERVAGLADLVKCFLETGVGSAKRVLWRMHFNQDQTHDRQLWLEDPAAASRHMASQGEPSEAGRIEVRFESWYDVMHVQLSPPNKAWWYMRVNLSAAKIVIAVGNSQRPVGLEGLSLVQALLSWGFSHDSWPWTRVDVAIEWHGPASTRAELEATIAPLLPLVAQHAKWHIDWVTW